VAAIPALGAGARLETGRTELEHARDLLLRGDLRAASEAFGRAELAFGQARDDAGSPALRLVGAVPLLGRSVDAVAVLADAGRSVASAGSEVSSAIAEVPGGIAELVPAEGALPIREIDALAPAVEKARDELEHALSKLRELPTSWVVDPVAYARDEAVAELERAADTAASADALTKALPSLMGADGERRYFVAAQSPAELRGTGGFIGAYTILTAKDGGIELEKMHNIKDLPDLEPDEAPRPPRAFGEPYDRFGGPGFWANLNMDPHAPTAASMIEALYAQVTGHPLDGVIFVDPQALADMLQATGPIEAPALDRTLEAGTVVDYLANEAYLGFGSAAERKRVLGAAVLPVLERFLDGTDPVASFRALAQASAGGHLMLHASDPGLQAALRAARIAGTVEAPADGDLFGVFASNADATKIDFYVHRSLSYRVSLVAGGGSSTEVTLSASNTAPKDPPRNYVFGPVPTTGLRPGVSRAFVTAYCAPNCRLQGATLDGEPHGLETHAERGLPLFSTYVETEPGSSSEMTLDLHRPDAWNGDELGGTYELRIRAQPNVQPTNGSISITAPPGTRIVDATPGMQVDGDVATWTGDLDAVQDFEIRFQQPPLARFWNLLSTPLFGE
jgi:hypothetical protein